jgi:hypothetical protein
MSPYAASPSGKAVNLPNLFAEGSTGEDADSGGRGKLSLGRRIQGDYLARCIARSRISRTHFARVLGVSLQQSTNWLSGREPLPSHYWLRVGEALGLDLYEFRDLICVCEARSRLGVVERIFNVDPRPKKPKRDHNGLASYFSDPAEILSRLLAGIEIGWARDAAILLDQSPAQIIHVHCDAAARACSDINSFLLDGTFNLFNERNIEPHLCYPHHVYVGFFLHDTRVSDGPLVATLKRAILDALEACIDLLKSSFAADVRIAQHAVHMLARYRGPPSVEFKHSQDPETRRMGYFGEVYRCFDNGPFEEMCELILTDEPFGKATFDFDRLHYRDFLSSDSKVPPLNTISRHIASLSDARPSIRNVAAARLCNVFRRLSPEALANPDLARRIKAEVPKIEGLNPETDIEADARAQLLKLAVRVTKGVKHER